MQQDAGTGSGNDKRGIDADAMADRVEREVDEFGPELLSDHPTSAEMVAFVDRDGSLDPARRRAVEAHVRGCPACRAEIALLRRGDDAD